MTNKVFVGNLSYSAEPADLEEIFSQFGTIEDVNIVTDRVSGKSRGFAFVAFSSADAAKNALSLDGKEIQGRRLSVREARDKKDKAY